jgi:hypothetical protein
MELQFQHDLNVSAEGRQWMSGELDRNPDGCRLCGVSLLPFEQELRLCSICEEYAQQLGVRNETQLDQIVSELLSDPLYQRRPPV